MLILMMMSYYAWVYWCTAIQCLDVILENLYPGFFYLQVDRKLDLAVRFNFMQVSGFLKCLGLRPSDKRLAFIKTSSGLSVLHHIARRYWKFPRGRFPNPEFQEWFDLGISILKSGADPSSIAPEWRYTPLSGCLLVMYWRTYEDRRTSLAQKLNAIRVWVKMVQLAGLDLCEYGAKETEVWRALGVQEFSELQKGELTKVEELVYGSTPVDWSLKISRRRTLCVYELRPPPGAFIANLHLPSKLIWLPTTAEEDEGPWEVVESKALISATVDIGGPVSHLNEPFTELVEGAQDDSGTIMLMQYRASRPRSKSRSNSQPPFLRRREVAYFAAHYSRRHKWLAYFHLCPYDSQWKFGCVGYGDERYDSVPRLWESDAFLCFHIRSCAKGISSRCLSVQLSRSWQNYSFLTGIRDCQDYGRCWPFRRVEHSGTVDCPQGCGKVRLNRLHVPESLRSYHPR